MRLFLNHNKPGQPNRPNPIRRVLDGLNGWLGWVRVQYLGLPWVRVSFRSNSTRSIFKKKTHTHTTNVSGKHKTMVQNLVLFLVKIWYRPERERERDVDFFFFYTRENRTVFMMIETNKKMILFHTR